MYLKKAFDISRIQENPYEGDQKTPKLFPLLPECVLEEINYNLYVCPILQRVDLSILLSENFLKIPVLFFPT